MKAKSRVLVATVLLVTALLLISCGTFITSNKVDEAASIKSWLNELGYKEKSNGFYMVRTVNPDNTYTVTKNIMFGNVDDVIVKARVLADRVKPVDDYQQFECCVELSNNFYFVQCWKAFYFEEYDSNKKTIIPTWKVPYKATYYLNKQSTTQSDFSSSVLKAEAEFTMNYAQFLDNHNNMIKEYQEELMRQADEQEAAAKADSLQSLQ